MENADVNSPLRKQGVEGKDSAKTEGGEAAPAVDPLKYQTVPALTAAAGTGELVTVKLRYKAPDGDKSTLIEFPLTKAGGAFADASRDFKFAAAVAGFGMTLRHSQHKGDWSLAAVSETASASAGKDAYGYRAEFVDLVNKAAKLKGN